MTALLIVLAIVVVCVIAVFSMYNGLVSARNNVDNTFATIDVMLKKRFDLIPNLVATVKQYAEHETSIFTKIAEARSANYANMTTDQKVELSNQMNQAQRSFFAVAENYPDLKASQNFLQLQGALNETEEQLSAARRTYNAAVTDFNTTIQSVPTNIIAGMFNFTAKKLLETPEVERQNVNVKELFK